MPCTYGICDECQGVNDCDYCDDFIPGLFIDDEFEN